MVEGVLDKLGDFGFSTGLFVGADLVDSVAEPRRLSIDDSEVQEETSDRVLPVVADSTCRGSELQFN